MSQYGNLPYEFRALETMLVFAMSELDAEYQQLEENVNDVLRDLDLDVNVEKLRNLLDISKQASRFKQKVKLIRTALHTVLEADDDMAAMYLSDKAAGKPRAEADHAEMELLLENYYAASGEVVEKAEEILSDVEYTHDTSVISTLG
jgi:magnesium transporter